MRFLKKYIFGSVIVLTPLFAVAQIIFDDPLDQQSTASNVISSITSFLYQLSYPLITLGVMYSGFLFITAGGNDESVRKAKKVFVAVLIGGSILILSPYMVDLVNEFI